MAGVFGREHMEVSRRGRLVRGEELRIAKGLGRGVRARVRADGRVRVRCVRSDRHEIFVPAFRGRITAHDGDTVRLVGRCRLDALGWSFTGVFLTVVVLGATLSPPDRATGRLVAIVALGVLALTVGLDRRTYAEHISAIGVALPEVLAQGTRNAAKVRKREHRA